MKLAAFQLVNGRVIVGRVDPKLYEDDFSDAEVLAFTHSVESPHEFTFIRGAGNQPTPAMMPYTVIPHVGDPLTVCNLHGVHVVVWEWASKEIEALYVHVTTGLEVVQTPIPSSGRIEIAGK